MSAQPRDNSEAPSAPASEFIPCRDLAHKLAAVGTPSIVIPPNGEKAPARAWADYQDRVPTTKEINDMFTVGDGIAWIMRDGHEVIDFDDGALVPVWRLLVEEECPGLVDRLIEIETPDNGRHYSYRYRPDGEQDHNQKLAEELRPNDDGVLTRYTLIETRGRGGLALLPGCPPACHPSGRPYVLRRGNLLDVPIITADERDALLGGARQLGTYRPEPRPATPRRERAAASGQGTRPGDEYAAAVTWSEILEPAGWQCAGAKGGTTLWRRPGKKRGISATTGHSDADTFYVFTSNGGVFEPGESYSKFGAYATLEHAGDHSAAASALRHQGYGQDLRRHEEDLPSGGACRGGGDSAEPSDQTTDIGAGFVTPAAGAYMVSVDARFLKALMMEAAAAGYLRVRHQRTVAVAGDKVMNDGQKLTQIVLESKLPVASGDTPPPPVTVSAEAVARALGSEITKQKDGTYRPTKLGTVAKNLADLVSLGACRREAVERVKTITDPRKRDTGGQPLQKTITVTGYAYQSGGVLPGKRMNRDEARAAATGAKVDRERPRCARCYSDKLKPGSYVCDKCNHVTSDVDAVRAAHDLVDHGNGTYTHRDTAEIIVPGIPVVGDFASTASVTGIRYQEDADSAYSSGDGDIDDNDTPPMAAGSAGDAESERTEPLLDSSNGSVTPMNAGDTGSGGCHYRNPVTIVRPEQGYWNPVMAPSAPPMGASLARGGDAPPHMKASVRGRTVTMSAPWEDADPFAGLWDGGDA